jgi:hypothetical protein
MLKWDPRLGVDAFVDRCIERRGVGWTWRKIAADEGVSVTCLYDFFTQNPDIRKKIDAAEPEEQLENIRQTGIEVAIKQKDRQLLMFYLKAKAKIYDTPTPPTNENKTETISPELAREILDQLRAKNS